MKQGLLEELEGREADCFALFPAYLQRLTDANKHNTTLLVYDDSGVFLAVAIAPATTRGVSGLRHFLLLILVIQVEISYDTYDYMWN